VAAIPVGRWLDRHGARALMTAGSAAATALVLAWARVTDLGTFYAIWAGIGVVMAAVLYEPAFAVIATWFRDGRADPGPAGPHRGRRLRQRHLRPAGRLAGPDPRLARRPGGAGRPAHPPHRAAQRHPPRPVARPPPAPRRPGARRATCHQGSRRRPPPSRALRDQALWWLAAAFFAATLATATVTVTVTVHLVAYLREQHYSPGFAATWTGLLGAMSVGGRILVTALGRRWPLALATAAVFALQALAVGVLMLSSGPAGVVGFVALFGLGVG
jgi:hypothetical protein